MSTTEARDLLVAHDPTRSYAVTEDAWYNRDGERSRTTVEYRITVFGRNVEQIVFAESANDLPTLIQDAINATH